MAALLDGAAGGEHQLESAIQNDFISITQTAEHRDPSVVIHPKIRFHAYRLIWILGIATEYDRYESILLHGRHGNRQLGHFCPLRGDLGLGDDAGSRP